MRNRLLTSVLTVALCLALLFGAPGLLAIKAEAADGAGNTTSKRITQRPA